jgi:hypothetical protein
MDPVPYEIQEEDVDEVLSAYEPVGGGAWTEEARQLARAHVLRHVIDLDDVVRTAPEDERATLDLRERAHTIGSNANRDAPTRREVALAAIEDLLIRDGLIDISDREKRVFPAVTARDDEHDDR